MNRVLAAITAAFLITIGIVMYLTNPTPTYACPPTPTPTPSLPRISAQPVGTLTPITPTPDAPSTTPTITTTVTLPTAPSVTPSDGIELDTATMTPAPNKPAKLAPTGADDGLAIAASILMLCVLALAGLGIYLETRGN